MTDHSDVENVTHQSFTADSHPTNTQVDKWCTWIDNWVGKCYTSVSAADKKQFTVRKVMEYYFPEYNKQYKAEGAVQTSGPDNITIGFDPKLVITKADKAWLRAANGLGDFVSFTVP